MDASDIEAAVAHLLPAHARHEAVADLPSLGIDDAYAIQDALVARLARATSGWKIGCTSAMAQAMSQTDEPFYGRMFADATYQSPAEIDFAFLFSPIVEPEIAFRLGRDLPARGAPYDASAVLDAIDALCPAVELVDCRYRKGWPLAIAETIADNGVHACFVVGAEAPDWRAVDRKAVAVHLDLNGETKTSGIGANALGDPLNALVWLANGAARRGHDLKAGEMITTGNTCAAPVWAKPGDTAVADFGALGRVELRFA